MFFTWLEDPAIGRLLLAGDHEALRFLVFDHERSRDRHRTPDLDWERNDDFFREPIRQLKAYFSGDLRQFDIPIAGQGTEFQQRVWQELLTVPYGETATYGDIAKAIGSPTASRAVGMANGRNPISIIVPCHRIIGSSGKLVGYGGGLDRKTALLKLEGIAV